MRMIRAAADRGHVRQGWLQSAHSFSFGNYYDPQYMGFGPLRVINEDVVAPANGFGMHPHRDMEIITYVLEGELEHRDTLGNVGRIRPGEVQVMGAGTGILHSEMNPSPDQPVHLLQMWVLPEAGGLPPRYDQKAFGREARLNRLALLVSRDGADGSLSIRQDARLYGAVLQSGHRLSHVIVPGRVGWLQVARGQVQVGEARLQAGDGLALLGPETLELAAAADTQEAEILLYDMIAPVRDPDLDEGHDHD